MREQPAEGGQLVAGAPRGLAEQVAQGPDQAVQHEPQPGEGQPPGRGVSGDQQQPELLVDPVGVLAAGAPGSQSGPTHLAVHHLRTGGGDDPESACGGPPAELDPVPEAGDVGIQPVEGTPVDQTEEHPAGGDAEVLLRLVALTLVDLSEVQSEVAAARPGDAGTDLADLVTGVVAAPREDQLGAGDVDARVAHHVAEQLLEGVGGRHGIVVQEPEPVVRRAVGSGRCSPGLGLGGQRRGDPGSEAAPRRAGDHRVEHPVTLRPFEQLHGLVGAAVVDRDQPGRFVGEAGEPGQGLG